MIFSMSYFLEKVDVAEGKWDLEQGFLKIVIEGGGRYQYIYKCRSIK